MPAKRTLKTKIWLRWFMFTVAVWVGGYFCLGALDVGLYGAAGRLLLRWDGEDYPQLHREGDAVEMETFRKEKRILTCPPVGMVELNEQTAANCFAALPLGAQDMATLLSYLQGAGIRTVGVSSPLTWEDEAGDMARQMFCTVLGKFPVAALGLRGRTAAQADFTPTALRETAIPPENIKGDPKGLPSANRPMPNGLTEAPDTLLIPWAPDWLEDEPQTQNAPSVGDISFPLLVRWNGETIPTLPLRLALKHRGLTSKDVRVHFGKEIRIGGRTLPLDEYGRTRLSAAVRTVPLPLADVVGGRGETLAALGKEDESCVILAEPAGATPDPARLGVLARTLSELAGKEHSEYITGQKPCGGHVLEEAPVQRSWWTLLWVLPLLAVSIRFLPFAPSGLRRLLALGYLACLLYYAYAGLKAGFWMSLSASVAAWFALYLALHCMKPAEQGLFHRRRSRR